MTTPTTHNKHVYDGNGSTTLWDYTFALEDAEHIEVTVTDDEGVETVLDSGYTVDEANAQVEYPTSGSPLAAGYKITLRRVVPLTQELDLKRQGPLDAENLETAYDKLTQVAQQQQEELARSLKLPVSSTTEDLQIPEPEAGRALQWNADADGLENGPTSDEISNAQTYATNAETSATASAASAAAAATSATNAATSATSAAASATAAANTLASALWRDVVYKTFADSPVTIGSSDNGKLIVVDTTGGAVVVNLPGISGLTLPFTVGVKLEAGSNAVTINRDGTDTIEGATSKVLANVGTGAQLLADTDPAPDEWAVIDFGGSAVIESLLTTKGDILSRGSSALEKLGVGSDGQVLQASSSASAGVQWASVGFTTGDVKLTLKNAADTGWVMMDDGTMGSAASGATTRANADTESLYTLLWNNVSDTYAPVSGGRGASAAADFAANKTIALPKSLGRALAVAGAGSTLTSRSLGQTVGAETHTLVTGEIPAHQHQNKDLVATTAGLGGSLGIINDGAGTFGGPVTSSVGGGGAHNNMQPSTFLNVMIKL